MKKTILSLFFVSVGFCSLPDKLFKDGNQAIIDEKYQDAIQIYESMLELNYNKSEVYYTLGNAYYKLDKIGQAIWSYMKALELSPRNTDLRHNLSVAKAKRIDRVELPSTFFVLEYYRKIKHFFTLIEWLFIGSTALVFNSLLLLFYRYGYFGAQASKSTTPFLLALIIFIHLVVVDIYFQDKSGDSVVVIENNVNAFSAPFYGDKTILFEINEGVIADVIKKEKNWVEINLIDGKIGWINSKSVRDL